LLFFNQSLVLSGRTWPRVPLERMTQDTIVQFSAPVYFVVETEELLTIDIIRLGNLKRTSTVSYHTVDASALAGLKFEFTEGQVTFQEDEFLLSITVNITQDETWSPTLEFKVVLSDPEECILVADGTSCRVKIIDDDMFPSNRYREQLQEGAAGIEKINQWGLFVEYVKLNFSTPGTGWRTVMSIVCDQMHNVYLFFLLKARTYLVNIVFDQSTSESSMIIFWKGPDDIDTRVQAARLVAVMYVLPMLALHIWDYSKLKLDIEGRSLVFLQTCIFRKYLNYTEASRQLVRVSHMQVALLSNTADLAKAYCSVLQIVRDVGKLILLMVFMLTQDRDAAWVLVLMPAMMLVWGCLRSKALSEASEFAGPLKKILIDLTTETCAKYRLIADYAQRPQMNDLFQKRAEELRRSLIPEVQVELNNNYFPKWLGPCFNAVYIAITARSVLVGDVSLGVFLATLSVFSEVSSDFGSLYEQIMDINTRLDALKTLTKYFNMETEVLLLKDMNRTRRKATKAAWIDALRQPELPPETGLLRSDLIPITLNNLCFRYPPHTLDGVGPGRFELKNVNLSVMQGKMVAIVGPHGSGKGTFLRLLSQTIFPTEGFILLPMHLRVLFVSQLPVLFARSPWYNLVFGRPDFKDAAVLETLLTEFEMGMTLALVRDEIEARKKGRPTKRLSASALAASVAQAAKPVPQGLSRSAEGAGARSLARVAGVDARTRGDYVELKEQREAAVSDSDEGELCEDEVEDDNESAQGMLQAYCSAYNEQQTVELDEDHSWQEMLSYTEQVKICLLRALLMNPEVLVLHRPFHNYDVYTQQKVLEMLVKHKEERGLGQPKASWRYRRPRTIFFTPESVEQAKYADVIWQIDKEHKQVVEISFEELQHGFTFSKECVKQSEFKRKLRGDWQGHHVIDHQKAVDKTTSGKLQPFSPPILPSR